MEYLVECSDLHTQDTMRRQTLFPSQKSRAFALLPRKVPCHTYTETCAGCRLIHQETPGLPEHTQAYATETERGALHLSRGQAL